MPRGDASPAAVREAALALFWEHGVAATSLQMISDRLGVAKAAVYHRFHTKDEIVLAVLRPAFDTFEEILRATSDLAPEQAVPATIEALAEQAVTHRRLWAVVLRDITGARLIEADPAMSGVFARLHDTLTGDGGPQRRAMASMFLVSLIAPATHPMVDSLSDDELREVIVEAGRRLLMSPGEPAAPQIR